MINRYPGKCAKCSKSVPAETGTVRKVAGCWLTYCSIHSSQEAPQERSCKLEGSMAVIRLPYDPDALPLLRSLPGGKWDGQLQAWTATVKTQADAARVAEIATKLGLDIPPELSQRAADVPSVPRAATAGLYDFQRAGVQFLATHSRALLADEPGLGKTVQALLSIPDGSPVVVVAPACVTYNWRAEAQKWRPDLTARVVKGKAFEAPKPGELVILSWAAIPAELPQLAPGTVLVADEAHFAKSYKSARSKRLQALAAACSIAWLLTGTPLANRPTDLYSVLQVGGMSALGKWPTFVRLFDGYKSRWGGYEWGTPGPEVAERLKLCMLRRRKSEVLTSLPAKQISDVVVGANAASARALRNLDEDTLEELEHGYLPRFEELAVARRELAVARIPQAIEFCEQYEESGEPIVVFSAHRQPVETLGARDGWACIHGDISAEDRTAIVEQFQAGELKGVAVTIGAGGVGITLTRASNALFIDLAWNPADNVQAEDRIHRIGQQSAVTIHRMVSDDPIDQRVHELLSKKIALIAAALDSEATYDAETAIRRARSAEERAQVAKEQAERAERAESERWLNEREDRILNRSGAPVTVELTAELRAWVTDSMSHMVASCDGARSQDSVGFNRSDAYTAHHLYRAGLDSDRSVRLAFAILSRYPRQVGKFDSAQTD